MIDIIITGFHEPQIGRAIEAAQKQKTNLPYKIIVSAPDKETLDIAGKYSPDTRLHIIKDPGKGKSLALNLLLKNKDIKGEILILSDGDCYVNDQAVEKIVEMFEKHPKVGCLSGRVIPTNDPTTNYGYFAHTLALGAHKERERRWKAGLFIECSGYLWAFRRKLIDSFPLDCAEDSICPLIIQDKGFKIGYCSEAEVYVKYPTELDDFVKQKVRTVKAHANLSNYFPNADKMKSFSKEIMRGIPILAGKICREIGWTIQFMFIRCNIWLKARDELKKNKGYKDGWETINSTK